MPGLDPAREAEVEKAVAAFTAELKDGMSAAELRVVWMKYITAGHKRLAIAFLGDARKVRPSLPPADASLPQG